jgi:hypothetical protein
MRGFATLRTQPIERPPIEPKRRCVICGAVLRPSNPGPECSIHQHVEIPEWMETLVEFDGRPATVNALAAVLAGCHKQTIIKARNVGLREAYKTGNFTRDHLSELYGLSLRQVDDIIAGRQKHH